MIALLIVAALTARSPFCVAVDGDTLSCLRSKARVHLRLNGIDTPELPGHCRAPRVCAPGDPIAAKANLAALVKDRGVSWVNLGKDKYGRVIAKARAGGIDLSCAQLKGGFAIYKPLWDNKKTLAKSCDAAK